MFWKNPLGRKLPVMSAPWCGFVTSHAVGEAGEGNGQRSWAGFQPLVSFSSAEWRCKGTSEEQGGVHGGGGGILDILEVVWILWMSYNRMVLGRKRCQGEVRQGESGKGQWFGSDPLSSQGKKGGAWYFLPCLLQPPGFGVLPLLPRLVCACSCGRMPRSFCTA